jgi:hypothetical protein
MLAELDSILGNSEPDPAWSQQVNDLKNSIKGFIS